ncbi:MAG: DUF2785 domain-containing protein [Undibacterium sp.]|nr:DUF2785 domain-containing protein [Undibacterium sp.]
MKVLSRSRLVFGALSLISLISLISFSAISLAACPPVNSSVLELTQLKSNQWRIADQALRQQTALNLLDCLSHPDPLLRDDIGFEALSFWMRGELLSTETVQQIRQRLHLQVSNKPVKGDVGFAQPFAALVLAEIARIDRRKAFMNEEQRQEMVVVAAQYLRQVNDFRGFDEAQGWRHGVAHTADWMMQLSLNTALNKQQHQLMLEALAVQIRNDQHFYHYGEPDRLMTPVFYLGLRADMSREEWSAWFDSLMQTTLDLHTISQASLARKHNLNAFLSSLYINLQESKQTALQEKLLPIVIQSLKKLN